MICILKNIKDNFIKMDYTTEYWRCNTTCYGRVSDTFPTEVQPRILLGTILDLGCSTGESSQEISKLYPGTILDLGCSTGESSQEISKLYPFCHVIGIDVNENSIRKARQFNMNPNLDFFVEDGYQMPFSNSIFKAVFCMNNLNQAIGCEMVSDKRIVEIAREIGRVIKPRGYLMFSGQDKAIMRKVRSGFEMVYYYSDSNPQPSQISFEALNAAEK